MPLHSRITKVDRYAHIVTLASRTGLYGGPFDTAMRQNVLRRELGVDSVLVSTHLKNDRPTSGEHLVTAPARRLFPNYARYKLVLSFRAILLLWREVGSASTIHISLARESIPLLALIFASIRGKHCIIQPHGMLTTRDTPYSTAIDLLLRPLVQRANTCIALTAQEKSELESWMSTKGRRLPPCRIIGNPVNAGSFRTEPRSLSNTPVVMAASRVHRRKRLDVFANIAAALPRVSFVVYGPNDNDGSMLRARAAELRNLEWRGALSSQDLSSELTSNCSIFVLNSRLEPWGNVMVEAICQGIPVVVPKSAALATVVQQFACGIVYDDDDVSDAVRGVEALLSPRTYQRASEGAIACAAAVFSQTSVTKRHRELLETTPCGIQLRHD